MSGTAKHTQHCLSVNCKKKGLKSLLLYIHISVSYFLTPAHTDIIHQPCKCNTVFSCIYITAAISKFYASAYFSDFIFKAIYINRTLDCFRFLFLPPQVSWSRRVGNPVKIYFPLFPQFWHYVLIPAQLSGLILLYIHHYMSV